MARERSPAFIAIFLSLCLGIAVYLRLWTIDFSFSKDDMKRLRAEFDLANREAMEESAVWRLKYDEEVKLREALEQKMKETESLKSRLSVLQELKEAFDQKMEKSVSIKSESSALQRMIGANEQLWEQVVLLTRELDNYISSVEISNVSRVS